MKQLNGSNNGKIIKITHCAECPNARFSCRNPYCEEAKQAIDERNTIPDWCPLENANELQDEIDRLRELVKQQQNTIDSMVHHWD